MAAKTFLFTGEESYLLNQELTKRKSSFSAKYGKENLSVYTTENFSAARVTNDIFGWGLFATQKLIIVYGIPTDNNTSYKLPANEVEQFTNELEKHFDQISDETIVVFVSHKPDKRTKLYKFLANNVTKTQECKPLTSSTAGGFLSKIIEWSWVTVTADARELIVAKVWTSASHLVNEREKCRRYAQAHWLTTLDATVVEQVIFSHTQADNFALLDYMLNNRDKAINEIEQLKHDGVNRNMLLGTLYWWCKNMLQYLDLIKTGTSSKDIAKTIGAHPFVISKYEKIRDRMQSKHDRIRQFFQQLITTEYAIKQGKLPDSAIWGELKKMIYQL